jgi:hypothetical protein
LEVVDIGNSLGIGCGHCWVLCPTCVEASCCWFFAPGPALTWFFEGLPRGVSIPWSVWIVPLFWWLSLVAALCMVLLCTVVILRKPWIEYERIDYPLIELPLAMVDETTAERRLPAFMQSPIFWIGLGVSIFGILWNIVSYFNPTFAFWRQPGFSVGASIFFGVDYGTLCGSRHFFFFDMIWFPGQGHGIPISD